MRAPIATLALLVVLGCGKKDEPGGGNPKPADDASTSKVSASTLWGDYTDNAAAADEKYKGKKLHVIGEVFDVIEAKGGYQIRFVTQAGSRTSGAVANFKASDRKQLLDLKPRQEIVVAGRCPGHTNSPVIVSLDDCELLPHTPAPSLPPEPPKGKTKNQKTDPERNPN